MDTTQVRARSRSCHRSSGSTRIDRHQDACHETLLQAVPPPQHSMARRTLLWLIVAAAHASEDAAPAQALIEPSVAVPTTNEPFAQVWTASDSLREGRGRGYCLVAKKSTRARMRIKRRGAVEKGSWLSGPRDHCYVLMFALDENRALAFRKDGTPCIASLKKLRLDSSDEELVLDDISLKAGGTLHVYVASNRLSGSCAYDVEAESDEVLDLLPEPTGGFRGLEKPTPQKTSGERVLCVDGGGARGVVPLAILAECERETRVAIRDQFDLFAGTSTGAIVAFGLAIAELPVAVLQRLYDDLVRLIFGSKGLNALQRQKRLQAVLEAVFGAESTLNGRKRPRRAVAVATDASTARLRPFMFRSFAPPEVTDDYLVDAHAHEVRIVDALLSSAAAPPYFPMRRVEVDGAPRRLLDGALVANNPTQFALAEAASLRRSKNQAKAVGSENVKLDLVVSLGTGSAPARATSSSGAEVRGLLSAAANLAAARDFVSGIIDLLTDTDATHDLVQRQLRDTWSNKDLPRRYHRLEPVVDARHLGLAEGNSECLRDLRAMALEYVKRDRGLEWRHLVEALQKRASGGTQRSYNVVDLDESMVVAKSHTILRPVRKKFARMTGLHGVFSKKGRRG